MLPFLLSLFLCLSFSCDDKTDTSTRPVSKSSSSVSKTSSLPIQQLEIAGETFVVELAFTRRSRQTGLMGRRELASDRGMLFVFADSQVRSFYMKNCLIDLDALFIKPDGAIDTITTMVKPAPGKPLRYYPSRTAIQYVLELPSGTAQRLKLRPGDKIELPKRVRNIIAEMD
jgi:uncharacterized membrane protein (UPF0127 family)